MNDDKSTCKVCEGSADGRHFGVVTCHSCRLFFRRSSSLSLSYACRRNGDCSVTKEDRNACRSCRYKRCLSTGMRFPKFGGRGRNSRSADHNEKTSNNFDQGQQLSPIDTQFTTEMPGTVTTTPTNDSQEAQSSVIVPSNENQLNEASSASFQYHTYEMSADNSASEQPLSAAYTSALLLKKMQTLHYHKGYENRYPMSHQSFHTAEHPAGFDRSAPFQPLYDTAKQCSDFSSLPVFDQVSLLREFAPYYTIIEELKMSRLYNYSGQHHIYHHNINSPNCQDAAVNNQIQLRSMSERFLDDALLIKFRSLDLDDAELGLLSGLAFWNTEHCWAEYSKQVVENNKALLLQTLEYYAVTKSCEGRLECLLLFIGALRESVQDLKNTCFMQ